MSTVQAVFNPMICSWHFSWHWCRLHLQAIIIKGFYVLVYNRVGMILALCRNFSARQSVASLLTPVARWRHRDHQPSLPGRSGYASSVSVALAYIPIWRATTSRRTCEVPPPMVPTRARRR